MAGATYICGGLRPEPRSDCPDSLHDWPLPLSYTDASEVAGSRIRRQWNQARCPICKLYGWIPGQLKDGETPTTRDQSPPPATPAVSGTPATPHPVRPADGRTEPQGENR